MKNVTGLVEEDWNSLEQLMWDLEVPFRKLNQVVNFVAILSSILGLFTVANFHSGTSTTPFLVTIGVSDVVSGIAGALFSSRRWIEGTSILAQNLWVCRTTLTLLAQVSFHMSRLGFLGLAGDRFLAIVYPLKYREWGNSRNGWISSLVFLGITLIINFPFFLYTEVWGPETGLTKCSSVFPFAYFVSLVILNPITPVVISVAWNVISAVVLTKRATASKARRATQTSGRYGAEKQSAKGGVDKTKKGASENRVSVMLLVSSFFSSFCDFTAQTIVVYWWNFNYNFRPITHFIELFTALNAVSNFPFYMTLKPMRQAFIRGITFGKVSGN